MSFFILLALAWILLWQYIPDHTPENLTWIDVFRTLFLIFSFTSFGFALLMLLIRFKGVDIAAKFIPHAGIVMWLGKHAYQYSQPKVLCQCLYLGPDQQCKINIEVGSIQHVMTLTLNESQAINLGIVTDNPRISWLVNNDKKQVHDLQIKNQISKIGRNLELKISIQGAELTVS